MSSKQWLAMIFGILGFCFLGFAQDDPPKPAEQLPNSSMSATVPMVTLDVSVLSKDGVFIPGLKQQNFRVFEDGVPQTLTSFNQIQGPITAVMLVEWPKHDIFYGFAYDSLVLSYSFVQTLKKDDRLALITYDTSLHTLQDFTQDKSAIKAGISTLQPPKATAKETNLFDALYDTLDRLETMPGKKYVILVSSGRDASSKRAFGRLLKNAQAATDVVIYSISTGQALRSYMESRGALSYMCATDDANCAAAYAQADNQMMTLAKTTGGKFYKPLFESSFRDAFVDLGNSIRNQYTLSYHLTNRAQDGGYRKIKVDLVGENGQPLKLLDSAGKEVQYVISTREGYRAVQQVQ